MRAQQGRHTRAWLRDLARGPALLAAALLALLLLQPVSCMIHCGAMARATSYRHANPHHHMLCSVAEDQADQGTHFSVPAFWPSLPAASPIWLILVALLLTLLAAAPHNPRSLSWSPPLHPPRRAPSEPSVLA
jgi:hypothetical protein